MGIEKKRRKTTALKQADIGIAMGQRGPTVIVRIWGAGERLRKMRWRGYEY
jgi:hypothetical protein